MAIIDEEVTAATLAADFPNAARPVDAATVGDDPATIPATRATVGEEVAAAPLAADALTATTTGIVQAATVCNDPATAIAAGAGRREEVATIVHAADLVASTAIVPAAAISNHAAAIVATGAHCGEAVPAIASTAHCGAIAVTPAVKAATVSDDPAPITATGASRGEAVPAITGTADFGTIATTTATVSEVHNAARAVTVAARFDDVAAIVPAAHGLLVRPIEQTLAVIDDSPASVAAALPRGETVDAIVAAADFAPVLGQLDCFRRGARAGFVRVRVTGKDRSAQDDGKAQRHKAHDWFDHHSLSSHMEEDRLSALMSSWVQGDH